MPKLKQKLEILVADDDEDDRSFVQDAFRSIDVNCCIHAVEDGLELMDFLEHRGRFADPSSVRPDLILLDLNMPRMDGFEVLKAIRSDDSFRLLPIVILTTSRDETSIKKCYEFGANAVVVKPVSFNDLVHALSALKTFWFDVSELPPAT